MAPAGSEKWRFPTAGTITGSAAVAADGTIYLGSRDAYLYALARDGSLKWSFDTRDTIESSPALGADGTIYLTSTGGPRISKVPFLRTRFCPLFDFRRRYETRVHEPDGWPYATAGILPGPRWGDLNALRYII